MSSGVSTGRANEDVSLCWYVEVGFRMDDIGAGFRSMGKVRGIVNPTQHVEVEPRRMVRTVIIFLAVVSVYVVRHWKDICKSSIVFK